LPVSLGLEPWSAWLGAVVSLPSPLSDSPAVPINFRYGIKQGEASKIYTDVATIQRKRAVSTLLGDMERQFGNALDAFPWSDEVVKSLLDQARASYRPELLETAESITEILPPLDVLEQLLAASDIEQV
jgi:hypothetical protein